jgi:hypothetical protein
MENSISIDCSFTVPIFFLTICRLRHQTKLKAIALNKERSVTHCNGSGWRQLVQLIWV